jgi:hypothetical protein
MGQRRPAMSRETFNAILTGVLNFKQWVDIIANKYLFDFTTLLLYMWGWSACLLGDAWCLRIQLGDPPVRLRHRKMGANNPRPIKARS